MSIELRIKQSIHHTARDIAKETGSNLGFEFEQDALDLIAELTFKKLVSYGSDLDAFQKHARRTTINADDVKLLVRNNESLIEVVDSKLKTIMSLKTADPSTSKRKRK